MFKNFIKSLIGFSKFKMKSYNNTKNKKENPLKLKCDKEGKLICWCGSIDWYEGPSGGLSVNIKCAKCGREFNYTPFGLQVIRPESHITKRELLVEKTKNNF